MPGAADSFNPLQTYTALELAVMMHSSKQLVQTWVRAGLIKGIKSGRGLVFTSKEIQDFQEKFAGADISNEYRALEALQERGAKPCQGQDTLK